MIKVFNGTDNTFATNGEVVLNPTRAIVHKEDNGSFYLDLETNLNEETKIVQPEVGNEATIDGVGQITSVNGNKQSELTEIIGKTEQNGTPTPTSPIPISNVSGLQEVEITNGTTTNTYEINLGKNLFDISLKPSSAIDYDNGFTLLKSTNRTITILLPTTYPAGTYKIRYEVHNSNLSSVNKLGFWLQHTINGNILDSADNNEHTLTLRPTADFNRIYFYIYNTEPDTATISINNIQLEKGSTSSSYAPYFTPIELNKIGNYKDYIFKGKGVNLFDKNTTNIINANLSNSTINASANERVAYIPCKPNTTYTLFLLTPTGYVRNTIATTSSLPTIGMSIDNAVYSATSPKTFTTGANAQYLVWLYYSTSNPTYTEEQTKNSMMIVEGDYTSSTLPPYEPYNAKDKWLLHKEIGKVVLNGSEGFLEVNASRYRLPNFTSIKQENSKVVAICTAYEGIPYDNRNSSAYSGHSILFSASSNLYFNSSAFSSVSGFTTWLASNNTPVYYVLNTPTTTEITNSELLEDLDSIELLDGLNNIMITSSDLPATLDIHYNYVSGGEVKTSYIDYLVANNILVANTPQGNQAFRITNVDKTRSKIRLQANHIFYDSQNYIIKDSYVVEKNCNEALDHLNNATDSESPFTTLSDVNTIASYRCVRKSLYEAIQVILERWGGHLVRDNFEIKIMDTIGSDNQVVVRYGKNLKNIEAVYDWNAVATKLMPVGADGLLLPEEWLYANNSYEIPYTKVISFDQSNINQEDYADDEAYQQALIDDLRQKGNEYLATNSVPMVNYTLDANLEKISDVGDTIEVIDERLGINLLTHLISFDYNCLLDRYEQLQFGNFTPKLNDLMSTISESTTQAIEENNAVIKATLSDELTRATDRIWQALGSSYIIYDGDKILVLDQLPKESAQNVIMINSGGIGFSNTGIDGTFTSAWTIDNILNMENINVINLTADLIRGGILKLGSNLNQYGQLEIYNEANDLIAEMNKDGFKMYGQDGSYILINNQVGLSGYDRNGTRIYWADGDAFHMKKSEVEEEITLCGKMRYIPIQISSGGTITNDGIGLVSVYGGE